jgi:hypothetical protein
VTPEVREAARRVAEAAPPVSEAQLRKLRALLRK